MIMNFFVLTASERTAAMALNDPEVQINPRAIDSPTPGAGLNVNDQAADYDVGDPVTLGDMFVAPYRIVNDSVYQATVPDMVAYLLTKPAAMLETETIFLPTPEIE